MQRNYLSQLISFTGKKSLWTDEQDEVASILGTQGYTTFSRYTFCVEEHPMNNEHHKEK